MVRQLCVEFELGTAQRCGEGLVQLADEGLGATHQGDEVGDAVLDVPAIDPSVVLPVVFTGAHAAGEAVVERFDEIPPGVPGMEEARGRIVQVPVIPGMAGEENGIGPFAGGPRQDGSAPTVIGRSEGHRDRLPFLEGMDIRIGLRLPFRQGGHITLLPEKSVDGTCRIPAPGRQCLLYQRVPTDLINLERIQAEPLDQRVGKGRDRMVRVHPAGVAGHLRKGRGPVVAGLLRHPDEGSEDVLLQGRVHHHAQRMGGAVGVPDPIVRVERRAAVLMDLVVEGAPVAAVLAQAHRTLEGPVVGRIENRLFAFAPAADLQAAQRFVPDPAAFGGHFFHVICTDFPVQVRRRLLLADEGHAVAEMHFRDVKGHRDAGVPPAVGLAVHELAVAEEPFLHGLFLHFHIDIHLRLPVHDLIPGEDPVRQAHGSILGGQEKRSLPVPETDPVHGALVGYGIIGMDGPVLEVHAESVGSQVLVVIGHRDHWPELVSGGHPQLEGRPFPMVRHDDGKAVHILGRIVGPLGIHPQHRVRELYGGESRHQQVADIADVRVNIVHGVLRTIFGAARQEGGTKQQGRYLFHGSVYFLGR